MDRKVIELAILTAGRAPSGANQQPWKFVVVSDIQVKRTIREAAEKEEGVFYNSRASDQWLEALKPLGTCAEKAFLEQAPYLIVIFAENYQRNDRDDMAGSVMFAFHLALLGKVQPGGNGA